MENSIISLVPPILVMIMVVVTRRVLLSLGVGIVSAALILGGFKPGESGAYLWNAVKGVAVDGGQLNTWNVYIVLFLFILGIVTAFVSLIGGAKAFGDWAMKRVKTRAGAQVMTALFGIAIFIDDYFNSLAVGQVARPITDRHRVSRAKLAYIIDSTSAPICVVSPVSSWGAYIIGIIGSVLAAHGVQEYTPFMAFLQIIPMNLYVWTALAVVFIVAIWNVDFGAMRRHEERAEQTGVLADPDKETPGDLKDKLPVYENGRAGDLIWPVLALAAGTVAAMLWTGYQATEGKVTLLAVFENTDVAKSLVFGGLGGLAVVITKFVKRTTAGELQASLFPRAVQEGIQSMIPAVAILVFAWTIITLIGELKTGTYLAGLVEQSQMSTAFLPFMLFLVAGIMAFTTGTSWGSFGILLPIAGEIAAVTDIALLLPMMAAVLGGAVFGDHCSPISDTTILSSTGAGCNHIDHVMTQLPYAFLTAAFTVVGYIVLGLTESTFLGVAAIVVQLLAFMFILKKQKSKALPTDTNTVNSNIAE